MRLVYPERTQEFSVQMFQGLNQGHQKQRSSEKGCRQRSIRKRHLHLWKREDMHKPVKYVEKAVTVAAAARGLFLMVSTASSRIRLRLPSGRTSLSLSLMRRPSRPGLASRHRFAVPQVRPEIRQQILDGKLPYEVLMNEKVGEIKATIVERDGKILMVKDCPSTAISKI